MPWFKVDDSLAFHAKTVAAGNAAMGLWVRAGAWCSQQGTEGRVPRHMVGTLGGNGPTAAKLVTAGLWLSTDDGYVFHDWLHYQPTNAEVQADRARRTVEKAEAGRLGGIASGIARRKQGRSNGEAEPKQNRSRTEADGKQNEAPTLPDPTPPVLDSPWEEEVEVELPADGPTSLDAPPARPALRAVGGGQECEHGDQYPKYCARCKAKGRRTG